MEFDRSTSFFFHKYNYSLTIKFRMHLFYDNFIYFYYIKRYIKLNNKIVICLKIVNKQ